MKSTKKFGSILTHEEKEYIDLGAPRTDALKSFKRKAYTWRKKDEQIKIIAEECGIDMEEERKIQGKE